MSNYQIAPKLVDIDKALVNTVIDQFAEATEACDRALTVSDDADRLSKTADRLSDEARIAEADAENVRAEAHSAEIDAAVHLSRLIVAAIKNATPSHLNRFYLYALFVRIAKAISLCDERADLAIETENDRWTDAVVGLIEDFNFNPNA